MIKTEREIIKIGKACKLAASVLDMITPFVTVGITTEELDNICYNYIIEKKGTPALLNFKGYPKTICTSINHQVCHGIPGLKKLRSGDILNIDVTVGLEGYYGDTSRMFIVNHASILAQRLVKVAKECLYIGIELVKPGVHLGDIGYAIWQHAMKNKFSVVEEFCGHGIGKNIHELPNVLHFGEPKSGKKLKPGMVFTIEPMINVGKKEIKILNGWTAVTKDHTLSAQWEHTILVTADGFEILTLTN